MTQIHIMISGPGRRCLAFLVATVLLCVVASPAAGAQIATPGATAGAIDSFYEAPAQTPDEPGVLLRAKPYTPAVPAGARAWRILYTTTLDDNRPALASGIVLAASHPADEPRPVVAWTHGTTSVATRCAPSAMPRSLAAGGFPEATLGEIVAE
jgi:hypothetical protein